jgi:DNA (cytosine-5)-methyltransferase 1
MKSTLRYIDLFAGAGGLSEGFIRSGFSPIAHVEMDPAACFTLKTRTAYHYLLSEKRLDIYTGYLKGEITRQELYAYIPMELLNSIINEPVGAEQNPTIHRMIDRQLDNSDVDLIIGGPPCQAYSVVGRARSSVGMKGDPRNYLYVQYAKYLEKYNPRMFVFENVLGLKSAKDGLYLQNMEKLFLKKGYEIHLYTIEANDFGVLQNRKRIIIIGWKSELQPRLPDLESISLKNEYTVKSVLQDLPKLNAGEGIDRYMRYRTQATNYLTEYHIRNSNDTLTQHIARPHTIQDKQIYRIAVSKWNDGQLRLDYNDLPDRLKTHTNRHSFFDRFKVVAQELPYSQTVVAHISKDGHYYIHPDIEQNRSLTIREAARLQSFPDDYYFEGVRDGDIVKKISFNRTPALRQIGNAVPPLMAEIIGKEVMKTMRHL